VKTTMKNGGEALMGSAEAKGDNRAEKAAIQAISSPLLDGLSIAGARNVLVNITSGSSLGIREATTATSVIQREAGENVEVIFGTVIDDNMDDLLRVTVIATGFHKDEEEANDEPGMRRTVPLDGNGPNYRYKGEDNLRHLDTPAYERRSTPLRGRKNREENNDDAPKNESDTPPRNNQNDNGDDNRPNIKRLRADDLNQDRPNRDQQRQRSSDDDTPAFLRKMMD